MRVKNRVITTWVLLWSCPMFGDVTGAVMGAGYTPPTPLTVALGQVITLFVNGVGSKLTRKVYADRIPLPTTLEGISVSLRQFDTTLLPIFAVEPLNTCFTPQTSSCAAVVGITVQMPFELAPNVPGSRAVTPVARLIVSEGTASSAAVDVTPVLDQVHVLNGLDKLGSVPSTDPIVTHGDGALVSATSPARTGEELTLYAAGLGSTNPLPKTGERSPMPAPVAARTFIVSYDYRPNASPAKVLPAQLAGLSGPDPLPVFVGLSPGSVGLYQVNFVVPRPPTGTLACGGGVRSNLTVTLIGAVSFDGAGICVDTGANALGLARRQAVRDLTLSRMWLLSPRDVATAGHQLPLASIALSRDQK